MTFKLIHIETRAGQPAYLGAVKITPFSQAIRVGFPGTQGGFIWNRPSSVLVKKGDGSEQVLKIPDMTRQIQIALLGFGVLGGILLSLLVRTAKRR
ncbi:MAG: hypothetical protein JSV61_12810 [Anaerolineales bacterium]|nr:MAG: hypothetical protein JSV61_12810 [Anaerolineales bacterium]